MSPKATVLFIMIGVPLVVIGLVVGARSWIGPPLARALSRLIDRYKIRPSLICGIIATSSFIWHIFILLLLQTSRPPHSQPVWLFIITFACLSVVLGYLIETIRKPPPVEFWPNWYSGDGDPSWVRWKSGMSHPFMQQFTLSWLLISLTIFCCFLGFQSRTISNQIGATQRHRQATLALKEFGFDPRDKTVSLQKSSLGKAEIEMILKHCESLVNVDLREADIDDETMQLLERHTQLKSVAISGTPVTDVGIECLHQHPHVQDLLIEDTNVTGSGLRVFARGQIRFLAVSGCPVSLGGLHEIVRIRPSHLMLDPTEELRSVVGSDPSLETTIPAIISLQTVEKTAE